MYVLARINPIQTLGGEVDGSKAKSYLPLWIYPVH